MPKEAECPHVWTEWVYDKKMYQGKGGFFRVCSLCGKPDVKKK